MKKIIITMLLAILIGTILGIYSYKNFIESDDVAVLNNLSECYAFQIGVFSSSENATNLVKKYGGIVIKDNDKYRVYIAIANNSLNALKKYFDDKKISYYLRNINVDNNFLNILNDYESKLKDDNYDEIIKNILKEYEKNENLH